LKLRTVWEGDRREAKVRTGLGQAHRPGSQGGLRKRGPRWNEAPTSRIERASAGNSPPTVVRAADLSRPLKFRVWEGHKMGRILRFWLALGLLMAAMEVSDAIAACDAVAGFDYRGAKIKKIPNSQAYFYAITRMAIDADGAPNAYHPQDKGIDAL